MMRSGAGTVGFSLHGRVFIQLQLRELRIEFLIVQIESVGILPNEISGKDAARQAVELFLLDSFQKPGADFGFPRDPLQIPAPAHTCAAQYFADGSHTGFEIPLNAIIQQLRFQAAPLITVVVVNWNRRDLLRACLESLRKQTGIHFEIIVVDNGSDDGSAGMVERDFAGGDSQVRIIRNRENRGFCAANNQGIESAAGKLVALLNNDAEADPGWLAALSRAFEQGPDVGMAASKILMYDDPRLIDKAGHLIYPDGQNRGRGTGAPDDGRFDEPCEILWPDGCAAMYRKDMLAGIGGFDEDFFAYADDAELGLRARIAGWRCLYVPDARVRHHRGSTLGILSTTRLQLIERNRVLLAIKLFPWSLLWLNGAYYMARLAAGAWAAFRGVGEATLFPGLMGKITLLKSLLLGDLKALPLIPRMLRKRREIRKIRKLAPSQVKDLILSHSIPLVELSGKAALQVKATGRVGKRGI